MIPYQIFVFNLHHPKPTWELELCFELKLSKILIEWTKLFTNISINHTETVSLTHDDRYNSINIEVDSSFQTTAACILQDSIKMSSDCLVEPTT